MVSATKPSASMRDPAGLNRTDRQAMSRVVRLMNFLKSPIVGWGLAGGILIWAAFPPWGFSLAAWPGMAIWIWLCRQHPRPKASDYGRWYLVGLIHWLMVVQWVRLPHWSAWLGWLALSLYLAAYLPLFIMLLGAAIRRGIPVVLAAPVIWTGLEWLRGHLFTGLSISLLGHTLVGIERLIQIADVFGAYGVSFLVVFVSGCLAEVIFAWCNAGAVPNGRFRATGAVTLRNGALAVLALVAAFTYGSWRITEWDQVLSRHSEDRVRVALIQGSVDTTFSEEDTTQSTFAEYARLTRDACKSTRGNPVQRLDLIIWPESMFSYPWIEVRSPVLPPADATTDASTYDRQVQEWRTWTVQQTRGFCASVGVPMLVGTGKLCFGPHPVKRFNSALYFDERGQLIQCYDKMRPVLFGEYVPLGNIFPWLYRLTPMPNGLECGTAPLAISCGGLRFSPCICFENTIPHLLRRQYRQLREAGQEPDVLVTLTNDGWFWGSSLLDAHLACGILRAVELRRPMLIAANTGFSAWIDAKGHVVERGPRRDQGIVIAEVSKLGASRSVYLATGDIPAMICACFSGLLLWSAVRK